MRSKIDQFVILGKPHFILINIKSEKVSGEKVHTCYQERIPFQPSVGLGCCRMGILNEYFSSFIFIIYASKTYHLFRFISHRYVHEKLLESQLLSNLYSLFPCYSYPKLKSLYSYLESFGIGS